jgi:photosystem II stability/assembly factor-like uncharacterized protein
VEEGMQNLLYIGTEDGLVTARSRDRAAWEVAEHGLKGWSVQDVAVSPDSPNKIFAGTRGDGVWVSEDFGKSWKKPCYGKRGPGKVRSVTIDPVDSKRIYAGCEPIDVFVSEDEGKSWRRFDSIWDIPFIATIPYPVATVEPHVRDVTIDPKEPSTIYAALQVGYIVKSTDGGETWRLLDKNVDCDVHTIVIDPADSRRIYITTGGHDSRKGSAPGRALYISEDAGESWTPTAMNFQHEYSIPLVLDPRNPQRLYSALADGQPGQWRRRPTGAQSILVRSDDGGRHWQRLGEGIQGKDFPEGLAVDEGGRIYAACRNGDLYASGDEGQSWQRMALNLPEITSVTYAHA